MENPGLKRYISTGPDPIQKEAFLTIIERRTAAVMPAPHLDTTQSDRSKYPMSDLNEQDNRDGEGHLRRDDIETPPPGKGSNTPGPSADNGAYGADPWIRAHQHHPDNYRAAGLSTTMIPGEVRVKRPPTSSGEVVPDAQEDMGAQLIEQQNKAAEQRRIDTQRAPGGGAKENPAYEHGQNRVDERMMRRRLRTGSDHPLFRGSAYDYKRNEWLYDLDNPAYFEVDPAPSRESGTRQSLLAVKPDHLYGGPVARRIPDEEDTISDGEERWGSDTYRENEVTREKASERLSALKPSQRHDLSEYGLNVFEDTRYPPPMDSATTSQPMIDLKHTEPHPGFEEVMDDPATYNPEGSCETCWLEDDNPHVGREQHHEDRGYGHPFKPFARNPRERYSSTHTATHGPEEKKDMREVLDVQGRDGNWNYSPYMHGLYNGLELMRSLADGDEPEFREAPDEWLSKAAGTEEEDEYLRHLFNNPKDALEDLFRSLPEAGKAMTPEERPWTLPTQQQQKILQDHGFELHHDHWRGPGWTPQKFWVKRVGNNDHYISTSREEPRGGAWETSIGPVDHWHEDSQDTVEPTIHDGFDNAFQRVTDPDGWYDEHMREFDADQWNRGKRVPGKTRDFDAHLRDQVIQPPDRRVDPEAMKEYGGHPYPFPKNPGLQILNSRLAAGELHGPDDMAQFEIGMEPDPYTIEDPYLNAMYGPGSKIHDVDPRSPQYDTDYERGWQQSQKEYDGEGPSPLEQMDDANASHAAYDGYMDYAAGRQKHHWRAVKRLGLDEAEDLPDEHWDHPEKVASVSHLGAQVPDRDDPVYPYSGRVDPEDTVDPENLQSGDDTYRPHHPLVDRAINHMQGLPDMSRSHPLMDRVNEIINQGPEEDTEESERGRNALAEGLNIIFDSTRENADLSKEEQLRRAKDAIDAHIETGKLTHKEHVKRLHDDWLARGGHATGEPRPVERFSPKYQKAQKIVPDPNNPFPELTSPIHMVGKCEGCGKRLYDSADSSGDPRGALGDHTVGSLDAAEFSPRSDTTGDRRMHGPSALICPMCDNDEHQYNRVLDRYRGYKVGDKTGDGYWGHPPGSDRSGRQQFIPYTHSKERKGKWHEPGEKPGECYECDNGIEGWHRRNPNQPGGKKTSALYQLYKQGETDEEFWARMEQEHPGQQSQERVLQHVPDAATRNFDEDETLDDLDIDEDDLPRNTLLREHTHLLRNGFEWDHNERFPAYTRDNWRNVLDSEGQPVHDKEGHVIERNTHIVEPRFPSDEDPNPHPLSYPWTHTYYPAGMSDDEGLVAGHNTVHSATRAAIQLGLWGARHQKSQELLKHYQYVGNELPYDPTVELPHEKAMRRQGAYDRARKEFLYNIESGDPHYYLTDSPPSSVGSSRQPMFQLKKIHDGTEFRDQLDGAYSHPGYPVCGWCAMNGMVGYGPENDVHKPGSDDPIAHSYQTVEDLPPGTRLAGYDFHPSKEIIPATKRSRQRYDYGSCPVCDAEVGEVCTSTRSDTYGRPITRPHPEREKVPLS